MYWARYITRSTVSVTLQDSLPEKKKKKSVPSGKCCLLLICGMNMNLVSALNTVQMARPILPVHITSIRLDSKITKVCHLLLKPNSIAVRKPKSINCKKNNATLIFI